MNLKNMQVWQALRHDMQNIQPSLISKIASLCLIMLALVMVGPAFSAPAHAQSAGERGIRVGPSGLPLPRFVSLKANQVNVRVGPGRDYDIAWIFVKGGLPVEVFQESDNWRRIRDAAGNSGWVFHSLLSGRRTALVTPWSTNAEPLPLYRERSVGAKLNARLESGLLLNIEECDGEWCRANLRDGNDQSYRGFVQQDKLWGVYPNEEFED